MEYRHTLKSSEPVRMWAPGSCYLLSLSLSLTALSTLILSLSPNHSARATHTHTRKTQQPLQKRRTYVMQIRKRRLCFTSQRQKQNVSRMKHRRVESLKYWDCDSLNSVSVMRAWTRQLASTELPVVRGSVILLIYSVPLDSYVVVNWTAINLNIIHAILRFNL